MRITIKNKEMKWSADDLLQKYPCEISICHTHNHHVISKEVLRRRRPSKAVEEKYADLFKNGHSPSSAISTFKLALQAELGEDYYLTAADRSKCPDVKWASRLYYKLFKKCYGACDGKEMLSSLEDYINKYNEQQGSTCVAFQTHNENDLIVAACTPLMKRVHEKLRSAGEVNFVDSSGTMDKHNHRVFLVMCPSVAGGLPLGCIITSSEAEDVLKAGFKLLMTLVPGNGKAFGGRGDLGPKIILTDDSSSERNALLFTFPDVELLLCIFHVLQAYWRYVWNSDHKVDKKDRSKVYFAFHQTVYAKDEETFETLWEDMVEMSAVKENAALVKHLLGLKLRAKEWALHLRLKLMTRGHNTNNISEAGMLLLKSSTLNRNKAFNVVQLLDFILVGFLALLERRLVDYINDRALNIHRSRYYVDPEKLKPLTCSSTSLPNFYVVKNTSKGTEYIVNMAAEVCSCPMGLCGATCKHQCAVFRDFNVKSTQLLNFAHLDVSFKKELLYIVYGSSVKVPPNFFAKLTDQPSADVNNEPDTSQISQETSVVENFNVAKDSANLCGTSISEMSAPLEKATNAPQAGPSADEIDGIACDLHDMVDSWVSKLRSRPEVYGKACQAIAKQSQLMVSRDSELTSAMFMFGKAQGHKALHRGSRKIPVNATSIARRKVYLGGRHLQITGRPTNAMRRKMMPEHNFSLPVSSGRTGPAWNLPPKKRTSVAPHSLNTCVSRGVSLGRTHHKK